MTREEIAKELGWAYINVESDLLDRIVRVVRLAEDAERQAIIQIITPSEECAKIAEKMLRFYTQGVTGVAEAIRARGEE